MILSPARQYGLLLLRYCRYNGLFSLPRSRKGSRNKIIVYTRAIAAALIVKIIGYYFTEVILYGNWIQPIGSIPGNVLQVVIAGIIVVPLEEKSETALNILILTYAEKKTKSLQIRYLKTTLSIISKEQTPNCVCSFEMLQIGFLISYLNIMGS